MTIRTLEDIAKSGSFNLEEHGAKARGLIELIQFREGLDYEVLVGFVIPASGALIEEVKAAFYELTANENNLRLILARDSSTDATPGKYKTIFVMYDPNDKEGSFLRFYQSYKMVVGLEPKAVIGQFGVGSLDFIDREDYVEHIWTSSVKTDKASIRAQLEKIADGTNLEFAAALVAWKPDFIESDPVQATYHQATAERDFDRFFGNLTGIADNTSFPYETVVLQIKKARREVFGYDH